MRSYRETQIKIKKYERKEEMLENANLRYKMVQI
jgi:hypothetical protein